MGRKKSGRDGKIVKETPTSFLDLPREIRDMIYDYYTLDVDFTNALTSGTAYTPKTYPLLYVHDIISEELQHRLYRNHSMVIPIQEPSVYATGFWNIPLRTAHCSRLMKQRSNTLILEMSQTGNSYYADAESEDDEDEPEHDDEFWRSGGIRLAEKTIHDILALKSELTAVTKVKLVFWFGYWDIWVDQWRDPLKRLMTEWSGLDIDIEFNLFEYYDHNDGIRGSNWIESWHYWAKGFARLSFVANNFNWDDDVEDVRGRVIKVEAWQDELFPSHRGREATDAFIDGGPCEAKPMFFRTSPMEGF
ncbi:hypothetical protein F53441_2113 [Fusarium austroafricanum]|uniref:Uncharacterized protein n=1 Tax=Fusarium austroafricanum TaxID=2364996 RepID=A0A8H4KTW5_9HYPO|nr:hypothetical protein F53441_2113 [Fusarium austroafricanum]